MIDRNFRKMILVALSVGCVSFSQLSMSIAATASKHSSKASANAQEQSDDASIRAQLASISKGVGSGEVAPLSSLWADDAIYTDDDGNIYKGKAAIEKRFASMLQNEGKQSVELVPDVVRMLASNVAESEGTVVRKEGAESTPETRYAITFVKQNGSWLISSATETPITSPTNFDYLKQLSWLIGDWSAERDGNSLRLKADWTANKNFIRLSYDIKQAGQPEQEDVQVIGFDPRSQQVTSWQFDSNGGFGQGNWQKIGSQWQVDASGVARDGRSTKSTNIIAPLDANSFSWQSIDRTVDGVPLSDTAQLKIQRLAK